MSGSGFPIDRIRGSVESDRASFDLAEDDVIAQQEKELLDEDEEVDKLLRGPERQQGKLQRFFGVGEIDDDSVSAEKDQSPGALRSQSRRIRGMARRRGGREESIELMHEMEDGANRSSTESSDASSEADRQELSKTIFAPQRKKSRLGRLTGIHIVILIAFAALVYGAYAASKKRRPLLYVPEKALSNGTHLFQPTTLLVSLDGFRADFLNRGLTPNLNSLVADGVSPPYMLPSFPSVTFPNHFTLVTGLYPESHSVVGNTFWDPSLQEEFYYTDPERSMKPRFWLAEPIWTTAEASGFKAAIHMWPGSDAHIGTHEPTFVDNFNPKEALDKKVDRIFSFIDLPGPNDLSTLELSSRPQLIAAYVPDVDADGHKYGPNSTEIRSTISSADAMIGSIMKGLADRNLTSIVNLVIVSDHGMATTSTSRMIQLDKIIDMSQISHTDGWPLYGLRPKDGVNLQALYKTLKSEAASSNGSFEVYLRDVDMPERYHFSRSPRIAPLWIVPAPGWAIVTKEDFDVDAAKKEGKVYHPRGLHGYDHEHPLMRAIFIARGPAFPHPKGSRLEPFQNVEVYGLVCDSLGLGRRPSNGTLRLPLVTQGIHQDIGKGKEEEDLPGDEGLAAAVDDMGTGSQVEQEDDVEAQRKGWENLQEMPVSSGQVTNLETMPTILPDPGEKEATNSTAAANETTISNTTIGSQEGEDIARKKSWLQWIKDKVKEVGDWAKAPFVSHKGEGPETGDVPDRPVVLKSSSADVATSTP